MSEWVQFAIILVLILSFSAWAEDSSVEQTAYISIGQSEITEVPGVRRGRLNFKGFGPARTPDPVGDFLDERSQAMQEAERGCSGLKIIGGQNKLKPAIDDQVWSYDAMNGWFKPPNSPILGLPHSDGAYVSSALCVAGGPGTEITSQQQAMNTIRVKIVTTEDPPPQMSCDRDRGTLGVSGFEYTDGSVTRGIFTGERPLVKTRMHKYARHAREYTSSKELKSYFKEKCGTTGDFRKGLFVSEGDRQGEYQVVCVSRRSLRDYNKSKHSTQGSKKLSKHRHMEYRSQVACRGYEPGGSESCEGSRCRTGGAQASASAAQ